MLDLFLAIIFSAAIPVLLKYAHRRHLNDKVILSYNYLIALCVSLIFTWIKMDSYSALVKGSYSLFMLIGIGMVTGLAYYLAFYFYQHSVRENGVSLSIAVGKMGIIIPMVLALFIWREMPTTMQWIGIAISMCAIALININPLDLKTERIGKSLLLFFIIGGLGDFFNKLFEMVVGAVYKDLFLVVIFASALVASLYKSIHIKKSEKLSIVFGLAVGIPNLLTAFFLINALSKLNATVVFPLYSGGAIVLSMLWSVVAFKEKLKWKKIVGIVLMLFALVLFNL